MYENPGETCSPLPPLPTPMTVDYKFMLTNFSRLLALLSRPFACIETGVKQPTLPFLKEAYIILQNIFSLAPSSKFFRILKLHKTN